MGTIEFAKDMMRSVRDYFTKFEKLHVKTEEEPCYGMETMEFTNKIMRDVYDYTDREEEVHMGRRYHPSNREEEVHMGKTESLSKADHLWEKIMKKRI